MKGSIEILNSIIKDFNDSSFDGKLSIHYTAKLTPYKEEPREKTRKEILKATIVKDGKKIYSYKELVIEEIDGFQEYFHYKIISDIFRKGLFTINNK